MQKSNLESNSHPVALWCIYNPSESVKLAHEYEAMDARSTHKHDAMHSAARAKEEAREA
jgi:hypothetical protein